MGVASHNFRAFPYWTMQSPGWMCLTTISFRKCNHDFIHKQDLSYATSNILVRWSGRVGAVSGFALSLMLRDRIREIVRLFPMPREPRLKASVTAWTGPGPGKITLITAREDDSTHTGREITRK